MDSTLEVSQIDDYAPFSFEEALSTNLPAKIMKPFQDSLELARDLTAEMVPGMSEFQIKQFVAGDLCDRVTPFGIYRQALREIGTRYEALLDLQKRWEEDQARLKILQAKVLKKDAELMKARDGDSPDYEVLRLEGLQDRSKAKRDNILRRLPNVELKVRDSLRQLVSYLEVYSEVKDVVPRDVASFELDRIEWEACVLMRYFKGKFGYIPTQFDNKFLQDCIELALVMRDYGFTDALAREVASEPTIETRWDRAKAIIKNDELEINPEATFGLHSGDDLAAILGQIRLQRNQLAVKNTTPPKS